MNSRQFGAHDPRNPETPQSSGGQPIRCAAEPQTNLRVNDELLTQTSSKAAAASPSESVEHFVERSFRATNLRHPSRFLLTLCEAPFCTFAFDPYQAIFYCRSVFKQSARGAACKKSLQTLGFMKHAGLHR